VTHDEIQKLMGGYATGSLSEAERRMLYEAALDDQDLFDQLAHEDSIRMLLDQPGVKDRLIASLAPAEPVVVRGGWKRPLAWGLATSFVVGMSLLAVFITRSNIKTQATIAQLDAPAARPLAVESAPVTAPPAAASSPAPRPPSPSASAVAPSNELSRKKSLEADSKRVFADKIEPLQKDERGLADRQVASQAPGKSASEDALKEKRVDVAAAAPPPAFQSTPQLPTRAQSPPPPPVAPQQFVAGQSQSQNTPSQNAQNSPFVGGQIQSQTGAAGGGGAGSGIAGRLRQTPPPARAEAKAKDAATHFGFSYSIEGQDLVFKFTADGYFSLHIVPGGLTIVDSRVTAGSTRRERINTNGTEADIVFSARPQTTSGGVNLTSTLKSDTVEDPNGNRIELLVKFFPPPQ
jgi:hypothetical protein